MDGKISRTRFFGISMMVYAALSMILIAFDNNSFSFDVKRDSYVAFGALLVFLGGLGIAYKVDFDKMYAIGIYAVTFGLFKIFKAYSTFTIDFTNFDFGKIQTVDIMAFVTIVLSISFIVLGISYIIGESKKLLSRIGLSLVFIIINIAYLKSFYDGQDWLMVTMMVVEIIVLVLFISLLASKDVRVNTMEAKEKYGHKIARDSKKKAEAEYAEAKKEAAEARKEGDVEQADAIMKEAKKEKKETIAEGKKLAKDAKKVRYVYNPETRMVEVKKDDDDDKGCSDAGESATEPKSEPVQLSSKEKLERARMKLDEESTSAGEKKDNS